MRNEKGRAEGEPSVRVPLCEVCGRETCFRVADPDLAAEKVRSPDAAFTLCYRLGYEREKVRAERAYAALDRLESVLRGLGVSACNGDYNLDKVSARLFEEADNTEHVLDGLDKGNAPPGAPKDSP